MAFLPKLAPDKQTKGEFPEFHPQTVLRDWQAVSPGAAFRIADAVTGVAVFGGTGSCNNLQS